MAACQSATQIQNKQIYSPGGLIHYCNTDYVIVCKNLFWHSSASPLTTRDGVKSLSSINPAHFAFKWPIRVRNEFCKICKLTYIIRTLVLFTYEELLLLRLTTLICHPSTRQKYFPAIKKALNINLDLAWCCVYVECTIYLTPGTTENKANKILSHILHSHWQ